MINRLLIQFVIVLATKTYLLDIAKIFKSIHRHKKLMQISTFNHDEK
jgi:hypothetical protein